MRHKKRSLITALAGIGVSALLLTGCSGGAGSGSASHPSSSSEFLMPKSPQKVTGHINWWAWKSVKNATNTIAQFNKVYPNVTVDYKYTDNATYPSVLRPGLAGSSGGPDVFNLQTGSMTQQFGPLAADVTPLIRQQLGNGWTSKLASGYDGFKVNGKMVAVPIGATYSGSMLVNKTMLDQLNIPLPTATTTLAQWKDACTKLEAAGKNCLEVGAQEADQNTDLFQAVADSYQPGLEANAVVGKAKWTNPKLVKALTEYHTLFQDGVIQKGAAGVNLNDTVNDFGAGKTAMILVGTWGANTTLEAGIAAVQAGAGVSNASPFVVALTRFPDVAGAGNEVPLYGGVDSGAAINPKTKQKEAATIFAAWLGLDKDEQQALADGLTSIPTLKGITPHPVGLVDPDFQMKNLTEIFDAAEKSSEPRQIDDATVATTLANTLQSVATGGTSAQDAAQKLQASQPAAK
jgi:ABC-type glycerol-3-phosphate transport system substrate-binding protein